MTYTPEQLERMKRNLNVTQADISRADFKEGDFFVYVCTKYNRDFISNIHGLAGYFVIDGATRYDIQHNDVFKFIDSTAKALMKYGCSNLITNRLPKWLEGRKDLEYRVLNGEELKELHAYINYYKNKNLNVK